MLGAAKQQRGDAQALGSGPDPVTQEPLVKVLDLARIQIRHWHGREYTRELLPSNAKWLKYSAFATASPGFKHPRIHLMIKRNGSQGVTLIELCFGLAIVAIIAGLALPSFRADLRAGAVRSATYELLAGLQQARAGAIVEGRAGVLCLNDSAGNCLASGAAGSPPSRGWQIFLEVDGSPAPLSEYTLPAGVELRSTRAQLRFWPDSLAATTGTLTICDSFSMARPRAVVVSQSGRARQITPADSACR